MDFGFTYTAQQEEFRVEVRKWLTENVPPDLNVRPADEEESRQLYLRRRALGRELGKLGWLFPGGPREYGGGGLNLELVTVLEEETRRIGLTLPPYYDGGGRFGAGSILVWGTEEQKAALLPPIYRGEVRTWQLLTEPTAGSDLAAVKSTAVRSGDKYILNGEKVFIGSSHGADQLWVLAVTDPNGERRKNLSWFLIDGDLPGIIMYPQHTMSTTGEFELDFGHKNTIYLENVEVSADRRIGPENEGWKVVSTHLELEHGGVGSMRPDPNWSRLLDYCRTEVRDGRRMIDDPAVRARLATIHCRLEAVRLLTLRNYWMGSTGRKTTYEGSQAVYLRKSTGLWLTKQILDIVGPYALTTDPRWGAMDGLAETQQREGIVRMHPGGTADVQRVIIARRLGLGKSATAQPRRDGQVNPVGG